MKSFAEQLSEHIQRIGVSDAELARRLGVSRQTIFRWREGETQRPRHREDILVLADKLRLTEEECDRLMMAAGFAPAETVDQPVAGDFQQRMEALGPQIRLRWSWWWIAAVAVGLLVGLLALTGAWRELGTRLGIELPTLGILEASPRAAAPGETLVLVADFANYGGAVVGYNVSGRLVETLRGEFNEAGLAEVRIETFADSVATPGEARVAAERFGAELIVWGEYDSGRVIAVVSAPRTGEMIESQERRWEISTIAELSTTINTELPEEARWMALYVLGMVHYRAGRVAEAEAAFNRALQNPPADPATAAALYFSMGVLESEKPEPDLSRAIAYYSEALALSPGLISALNNRGVAYLQRSETGDLDRAEADFSHSMELDPDFPPTPYNLALAKSQREHVDLEEVLALLRLAESLDRERPGVQNALCWFYSLAEQPEEALPHCELAVELDPSGYSNDSRGLALALMGRHEEAAAEFRIFLEKLQNEDPQAYRQFAQSRLIWIEALAQGVSPFDEATLETLLHPNSPQ